MSVEVYENMLGKEMISVSDSSGDLVFKSNDGKTFKFTHFQCCCENTYIAEIIGDLEDLVGSPLTMAEQVDNLDSFTPDPDDQSSIWTFYKFGTHDSSVTVRWYGDGDSYYGVEVSYVEE